MNHPIRTDTIVAIATPPGRGGVGIVRVSGPQALAVGEALTHRKSLTPRKAHYGPIFSAPKEAGEGQPPLDMGITLFFENPQSYTGEDVVEFQAHGGPILLEQMVKAITRLGPRPAEPGEFTKRAFLNGKMDLAQAEAVADVIAADSEKAAQTALATLRGGFSLEIRRYLDALISLRTFLEAANDFPEDEVDILDDGNVTARLQELIDNLSTIFQQAREGVRLQEGLTLAILGAPNAGKSSLLNALTGEDSAIVTHVPGTTRDLIRANIQIDGWTLELVDTAGIRETPGAIEQEGIRRAQELAAQAECLLFVVDAVAYPDPQKRAAHILETAQLSLENAASRVIVLLNKIDQQDCAPVALPAPWVEIPISAKMHQGLETLRAALSARLAEEGTEARFMARRRHLDALGRAKAQMDRAMDQLAGMGAIELIADDLRVAQSALSEITGAFSSDDLLGEIFSTFCLGK